MAGVKYAAIVAASSRIVAFYKEQKYENLYTQSNAKTVEYVSQHPTLLRSAKLVGPRAALNMYGSISTVAALTYFGLEIDKSAIKRFLDGPEFDDNLSRGNPVLATRNFFINATNRKLATRQRFALLIKGWDGFYEERSMEVLRFSADEKFPTISGQLRLL